MKRFVYGVLSWIILVPSIALAQWNVTTLNTTAKLPAGTLRGIITQVMNWFLAIVGIIGIIGFVISGILYFLAAGDEGKMGTAKNAMTYSIIGVVVALMGYVIIQAVNTLLGGTSALF